MNESKLSSNSHSYFHNDSFTQWFKECRFCITDNEIKFDNPDFFVDFGLTSETLTLDTWLELTHCDDRSQLDTTLKWSNQRHSPHPLVMQYRVKDKSGTYILIEQKSVVVKSNNEVVMLGRIAIAGYPQSAPLCHAVSGLKTRTKLLIDISHLQKSNNTLFTIAHIKVDDLTNQVRQFGPELLLDVTQQLSATCQIFHHFDVQLYQLDTDTFMLMLTGHIDLKLLDPLFSSFVSKYMSVNEGHGSLYADKISIGVIPNNDNLKSGEQLLELSTQTRRYANSRKDSSIAIYSDTTIEKIARFSYIEKNLKKAIKYQQLCVNFHPIIDLKTQQISSFESLVRWNSDLYGQIGPIEFIHVAEKQGLIYDLGIIVFTDACQFLEQYNKNHSSDVKININVSVLQLLNSALPSHFRRIALHHGLTPSSIVLELTETVNLDDDHHALAQLRKFSDMGFILSLDDFGAGMTSMNTFFDFPFQQIKIDRNFALRAMNDSTPTQFLQFLTNLCDQQNISIVVEGVETNEMLEHYLKLGASHLQGYFYSLPLSVEKAMQFVPQINSLAHK